MLLRHTLITFELSMASGLWGLAADPCPSITDTIRAVVWDVRPKTESRPAVCEVSLLTLRCCTAVDGRTEHLRVAAVELLRVRLRHSTVSQVDLVFSFCSTV